MSARHLPPVYIDIQEEIERSMTKIKSQMTELNKLHQKRLKESFFSDDESLQMKIIEMTRDITSSIKHSEKELRALGEAETDESSDEQIRKNMRSMLAEKLKDATFELRRVEKEHYMKV